ncbi:MAG: DegT/DnrJ/EryC1/StrS family aminotransferase [Bowdeniella nasicola]|nr:DegT/DnrJ/EryC1/StrS family aminotransferase [Bowdeniella nasicola]
MFDLDLTQPEPIPAAGIDEAVSLMQSGRLFRYNGDAAVRLEVAFAELTGSKHALAVNSGGSSIFLSLIAAGVQPGDTVLLGGFTLAPVPGAIVHAGARPILVDVTEDLVIDTDDLRAKADQARFFLLSHMRGHISNMAEIMAIAAEFDLIVIEDCAHTLGATWDGKASGTFGIAGCYSLQTYKHLNCGEGGVLVTDDADLAARAIIHSGSYMHYQHHQARPPLEVFERWRAITPNYSMRLTNLAAALALPQIPLLAERAERMNRAYNHLATRLRSLAGVRVPKRDPREAFIGSSIQFFPTASRSQLQEFTQRCADAGLPLGWFGRERMEGFTSRPAQWDYLQERELPETEDILANLMDLRIPPAMTIDHCDAAVDIINTALTAVRERP